MRSALSDLKLDHIWVVYPGDKRYLLDEKIEVLPVTSLTDVNAWRSVGPNTL
jgi:hypothetical protein